MAEDFVGELSDSSPAKPDSPIGAQRDREAVQVMLVGSRRGIANIICSLYVKEFAEIHEWNEPQPAPGSGKLISVTTKYLTLD